MLHRYLLPAVALVFLSPDLRAQAYGELGINEMRVRFYANGRVGSDAQANTPHFEVPQGSGAHALYAGGLWVGGQTAGGQLRVSKTLYDQDGIMDFRPGPLTTTDGTTTQAVSDQYDQVWRVTRAEVTTHLAYTQCAGDPNCDVAIEFPGYTIPPAFLDWPAMGDIDNGYDPFMAPFYDYDQDGSYDPYAGDAPCILGDEALFFVFNDHLGAASGNVPLGIEVQAMPFAYNTGDAALDQTVFIRYHLINRSVNTYSNTMVGFFNDFDLGCSEDDFIGCDPARGLAYGYNWDNDDEGCFGSQGYGVQPPAIGMALLKGPLVDANGADDGATNYLPNWNGQGFGDGVADNERFGLAHFLYFSRQGPDCCTDPVTVGHHYNYMRGIWKDGVTMSYGGVGYNPSTSALACAFMYPGAGDPVGAGTGGQVQGPWYDISQVLPDRRGVMSMGALTLEPGEHMDLLFAYVFARAGSGGALASVGALQSRVDSVRTFAQTLPIWGLADEGAFGSGCLDYPFLGVNEAAEIGRLALFPSPASDQVTFDAQDALVGGKLSLRDATGRVVLLQRVLPGRNGIDISSLAPGVYTCEAGTTRMRYTGRIVKE